MGEGRDGPGIQGDNNRKACSRSGQIGIIDDEIPGALSAVAMVRLVSAWPIDPPRAHYADQTQDGSFKL
jgi:hypothetical protein